MPSQQVRRMGGRSPPPPLARPAVAHPVPDHIGDLGQLQKHNRQYNQPSRPGRHPAEAPGPAGVRNPEVSSRVDPFSGSCQLAISRTLAGQLRVLIDEPNVTEGMYLLSGSTPSTVALRLTYTCAC
jgi:hypothetical protein